MEPFNLMKPKSTNPKLIWQSKECRDNSKASQRHHVSNTNTQQHPCMPKHATAATIYQLQKANMLLSPHTLSQLCRSRNHSLWC